MANVHSGTKAGTAGGTLLSVLSQIHSGDVVQTCVLAAVGATVSFVVSLLLKWGVEVIKVKGRSDWAAFFCVLLSACVSPFQ